VPRAPPFFGQIATKARQFPQRAPFFIAFSQKHVQIPCNAVVGVVEWSYISIVLRLFPGSRTAFARVPGKPHAGGGVIPVGRAVSSYKNPGQPAALRRLAAGREEEEHKK